MTKPTHSTAKYHKKVLETIAFIRAISVSSWKKFGALTAARMTRLLLGLLSSALWARYVPETVYGQYQLISSIMGIVAGFCLKGLAESLSISAAKHYDGNLSKIFRLKTIATVGGSLALGGFAYYYSKTQPEVSQGLLITAVIFPVFEIQKLWTSWFTGRGKLSILAILKISNNILSFSILGLLIWSDHAQLPYLISWLMGGASCVSIFALIHIFRSLENKIGNWETIKYGFHTTTASLLSSLILSDKILINEYLTPQDLAIYSIALLFPSQIKDLYSIFNQMFVSKITKAQDVRTAWLYLRSKFFILLAGFFIMSVTGFWAMPIVIPLVFSERYIAAVPLAKWLWLGLGILEPFTFLSNILFAQQKKAFTYFVLIGFPILISGLYFILIPQYGLFGAVMAKLISATILSLVNVFGFSFYLKLK